MNKIIASVGLVALGAANIQAQSPIAGPATKWWNVQATVRGFYDDNINTVPSHQAGPFATPKDHVWGYEVNPKIGIALGNDQTTFTADYQYSLLYYDHTPAGSSSKFDQDHTFNAALAHAFSERFTTRVRDSFVIGQEPDALRYDAAFHTPFRVSGNNIVNYGEIVFNAELTPKFGIEGGYGNAWFDYKDRFNAASPKNVDPVTFQIRPSVSGVLDRIEQTPYVAFQWKVQPTTTASVGYRFQQINYTADEPISGTFPGGFVRSDIRDSRSHTVYLGLDHQFRPDFYGSIQAGASYYDYYNLDSTSFGPFARLSLTYVYMPESYVQVGFQEGRSATDIFGNGGTTKGDIVRDSEASVFYAKLHHRIVAHLFGNLDASYQHSAFQGGGTFDNMTEDFLELGANIEYQFNSHFSAHVGYDFDRLDSDISNRSYTRNKAYIGATASY